MKKARRFARYVIPLLFIACFAGNADAAPYGPKGREINWVQPSGEKLKLRVIGDDYYARTETEDGYTVAYNSKDGAYHYAEIGPKGAALKPSGVKADLPAPKGQARHLDLPADAIRQITRDNRTKFAGERDKLWNQRVQSVLLLKQARLEGRPLMGAQAAAAKINAATVEGKKIGLTILAQFPNDPKTTGTDPVKFPVTRGKIVNFCNQVGYNDDGNTGSVRDFYYDQSLGMVTYTQTVTQIVTLPHPRNYYNYADYPQNSLLQDTALAGQSLIEDAVTVLKTQGFDFSSLTVDTANNAIATNLFFAGSDSGVWAQGLWPHQYHLESGLNVGTTGKPINLFNYQVTNIENAQPVIGTFCHENGHLLLGYPDLYDTVGEGVGEHCLMGSGNYLNDGKTPSPINAYFKDIVGWANVTDLDTTDYVTKTLPTTGNVAFRLTRPGTPTEFFMVENRGKGDKWAKYSDDTGIAIWHVDETVDGNIEPLNHYEVALEQSDGRFDLEKGRNRGDTTDLFDLTTPLFTDSTSPNANWWNGSNSSIRVKVLGNTGAKTAVQFGQLPKDTIIVEAPNGGEILYRDSKFVIKWEANIVGDVKIDLYNNGVFASTIVADTPNTGSYNWTVPASMSAGQTYKIRISSLFNTKQVDDFCDDFFGVTDSTFPPGNVMPYGWKTPADADAGWEVTQSSVYEGTHSLVSKPIGDGKTAAVSYTSNFKAGNLSFYLRVSSEVGYDYATFYLDGVRQTIPTATSQKGLTGRKSWVFVSFPIDAGNHTFKWAYIKDDSYAEGRDSAWVDGVLFPATTQEIAVENSDGVNLLSGKSAVQFPNVRIGSSSAPQIFTIWNRGKADLTGLKIATTGSNGDEFVANGLGSTVVKPGKSTTFQVKFSPVKPGSKSAQIQIQSNDVNEDPFIIGVAGKAIGLPEIQVFQPSDTKLKDGKSVVSFGYSTVGVTGNTKTFTIKNVGNANMNGIKIAKSGVNKVDFSIGKPGKTVLAPAESTTFKVTFTPSAKDQRVAMFSVTCDYKPAGSFDVNLQGKGAPKNPGNATLAASSASPAALLDAVFGNSANADSGVTSTELINGQKYLTLTYAKPAVADGLTRTVEVSPNLVDWFSGRNHTTIVTDNEDFRKVRDNTPVTPDDKRYIRLKTTRP